MLLRLLLVKARAEPTGLGPASTRRRRGRKHRPHMELFPRLSALQPREAVLDQALDYAQLEQGARYLASLTQDAAERREHLGWANRYSRLKIDASEGSDTAHASR